MRVMRSTPEWAEMGLQGRGGGPAPDVAPKRGEGGRLERYLLGQNRPHPVMAGPDPAISHIRRSLYGLT
jgi:hypothetical protein